MKEIGQSPTNNMGGKFGGHDLWGEAKPYKDFHTIWRNYLYVHCMCSALTTHGGVMKRKDVNFTIRLSADLKRDAETAAALLDVTLSQVIRKALLAHIRESERVQVNLDYITQERRENLQEIEETNKRFTARGLPPLQLHSMKDRGLKTVSQLQSNGVITPEKAKTMREKLQKDYADE